ncbi:hypothetical protein TELCIR_04878 [Teladorsagia circumcincta]|uniref:PPM-type phosphatase domain-containing protein n=1 Tax=Teladorsagia circumcincta TaxID=45464 RepID=A0A2G9USC9_TELCI|nr:hypothetical protein TELCIR_04878 [Teladorsagia circumcincta]
MEITSTLDGEVTTAFFLVLFVAYLLYIPWRIPFDAHNCIIELNGDWSMFAVYDGHGGDEVSKYTAMKFPDFLKEREFWASDDLVPTLQQIFVDFDDVLRSEEVMKELKRMAKESEDVPDRDDDCDNSSDECDRIQTIEESAMPLEEILSRFYRQGYVIGRNLSKGKPTAEVNGKVCCNNEEPECGEDKCPKGKRQSRSPTQEPAKRAKTEGNGSILNMLINTDGEGDTVSTEVNASESGDSIAPVKDSPNDPAVVSNTNNSSNSEDHAAADEHKAVEGNGQTPPIIKTKQKKVPVNADKKADDGIA